MNDDLLDRIILALTLIVLVAWVIYGVDVMWLGGQP